MKKFFLLAVLSVLAFAGCDKGTTRSYGHGCTFTPSSVTIKVGESKDINFTLDKEYESDVIAFIIPDTEEQFVELINNHDHLTVRGLKPGMAAVICNDRDKSINLGAVEVTVK